MSSSEEVTPVEIYAMSNGSWPMSTSPVGVRTLPAAGSAASTGADLLAHDTAAGAGRGLAAAAFAQEFTHKSTRRGVPPRGRHR